VVVLRAKEILMRILALATLAIGAVMVAAPAQAQMYSPDYPICLHVYGPNIYNDCRFTTMAQCYASASGLAGQCRVNPFLATTASGEKPASKRVRRGY
jgi:hypothetical protein